MSWAVAPDGRYERFPVAKMARRVPGCPHWLDQSGVCILLALGTHTPELTFLSQCPWSWGTTTFVVHDAEFPARSVPL